MDDKIVISREILRNLLSSGSLKGARLRPAFVHEFERRTGEVFQSVFRRYPKFSDLLREFGDLLEVIPANGPGDIEVRLRVTDGNPQQNASLAPARIVRLPTPIWHAFTNPDENRKRYVDLVTHEVVHFSDSDGSATAAGFKQRVESDPRLVQVDPISAAQQGTWMTEFLATQSIADNVRQQLALIANLPYSSHVNRAFTAALGPSAFSWQQFRTSKVEEFVRSWFETHGAPSTINAPSGHPSAAIADPQIAQRSAGIDDNTRRLLHAVVDAMDERELANMLVPASVLSRISAAMDD